MRYVNAMSIEAVVGTLFVRDRHVVLYNREVFGTELTPCLCSLCLFLSDARHYVTLLCTDSSVRSGTTSEDKYCGGNVLRSQPSGRSCSTLVAVHSNNTKRTL